MALIKIRLSKFPEHIVFYGSRKAKEQKESEIKRRQGRICEICNHRAPGNLNTDHDHRSKIVRGFICDSCNSGLGCFGDNFAVLRAAADYLERAYAKNVEWWKIMEPEFAKLENPEDFLPSWMKSRTRISSRKDADNYFYD